MIKKGLTLFLCCMMLSGIVMAQFCGTDMMNKKYAEEHPEIAAYRAQLEKQIQEQLKLMDLKKMARTTAHGDTITIPVVVHVVHDYGTENVSDANIYKMLDNLNDFYNLGQVYNDTSVVIAPYKKWIGNAHIRFRLATKDPMGQPTKGVKRYYSYLTYGSDDFAKIDLWNPSSYMNIWVEAFIGKSSEGGGIVAAYAVFPSSAAAIPWSDGVMTNSQFITTVGNNDGATIPHEVGHYLNLFHTFGGYNQAGADHGVPCSDDEVDDTPPTHGNQFGCALYDTSCAQNYFKIYASHSVPSTDSIVDYPDTVNVQNIMNYADCKAMFTKGQVARMRAALNSNTASRNNLWSDSNLILTGVDKAMPDLKPVADFNVQNSNLYSKTRVTKYFLTTGKQFYFKNQSWDDTVSSLNWTFPNGTPATVTATTITAINTAIGVSFSTPGWADVTLVANSNAGSDTVTKRLVYVADPVGVAPKGYFQEFNSGGDLDKWPIFNYYASPFRWQISNTVGYYDNNSIMYTGWDSRSFPAIYTGTAQGQFNDFFSRAFDLSAWAGSTNCNLNFMYAGTYKTGISLNMNDTLEIAYSIDGGNSWAPLDMLTKSKIASRGSLGIAYAPLDQSEWALYSHNIPAGARTASTFFRFRYKPGTDKYGNSSGNNFYMDRINVNDQPLGVNTLLTGDKSIMIMPNPTSSNAYVLVKEQNSNTAKVIVTDVTGKQVYATEQQLNNGAARIEIPASTISVKGMYMVQVISGNQSYTDKLVVY